MRKHSPLNWFKCDVCDHIFSDGDRGAADNMTALLDKKPPTAA
jgi:hypothetical protein